MAKRSFVETARLQAALLARQGGAAIAAARKMGETKRHALALALDGAGKAVDQLAARVGAGHAEAIDPRDGANPRGVIVFIPGFQQRIGALQGMAHFLAQATGCRVVFARQDERGNVWPYQKMLDENRPLLATLAEAGLPIVLVGYSRGGCNAADFANALTGSSSVPVQQVAIVTVAMPLHGSPLAHFAPTPAGSQMRPGHSECTSHAQLFAQLDRRGVHIRHLRFAVDAVVPPAACHADARVVHGTPCHYSIHLPWVWGMVADVADLFLLRLSAAQRRRPPQYVVAAK